MLTRLLLTMHPAFEDSHFSHLTHVRIYILYMLHAHGRTASSCFSRQGVAKMLGWRLPFKNCCPFTSAKPLGPSVLQVFPSRALVTAACAHASKTLALCHIDLLLVSCGRLREFRLQSQSSHLSLWTPQACQVREQGRNASGNVNPPKALNMF